MQIVINISEKTKEFFDSNNCMNDTGWITHLCELINAFRNGTTLPAGHGRLGDLDELEQRISNFVERDAHITDEYTVVRQRFIVDGIRQTIAIIEADGGAE